MCVCVRACVCMCSLSHPAFKAHAPYYTVVCGQSDSTLLSHKQYNCQKTVIEHKSVFWSILQLLIETFLIIGRIQRDNAINIHRFPCRVPVILVRFEWKLNFLDRFSKNAEISNFMKILPVRDELFRSDAQTHMKKPEVASRTSENAPKNLICQYGPVSYPYKTEKPAVLCILPPLISGQTLKFHWQN